MALLSYKYKTLFVHIFKTAGTSVRDAMKGGGCEEILVAHSIAKDVKYEMKEEWNNFYSFAFTRNPYDWMISLQNYIRQNPTHFLHQECVALDFNDFIGFYVKYCLINPHNFIFGNNKTVSQYDFVTDNGEVIVNYLGKQETLEYDLRQIEKASNCKFNTLQRLNTTSDLPIAEQRKIYNPKGIDLMCEHYANDFILGNYSNDINMIMQGEGKPFNGDTKMMDEFIALRDKYGVTTVIETGTYKGDTTRWLASNFDSVLTIEVIDTYYKEAQKNLSQFPNAQLYFGNSVDWLSQLTINDKHILIFLDAHWYQNPLLGEMDMIAIKGWKPILVIHDFFNPEHPEYQFDKYPEQNVEYKWDYVKNHIEAIYGADGYEKYYNKESTGDPRIGCLFIIPK